MADIIPIGYVCFKNRQRLTAVKKLFPRAHLSKKYKYASIQENITYCQKETLYKEFGIIPISPQEATKLKWETVRQLAKEGKFEEIPADIYVRYYHTLKRIHQDNPIKPKSFSNIKNYWIIAPTGYGKSTYARQRWPDYYDKEPNKWWVGYKNEPTILLDDLGPDQCKFLSWYLKRWADRFSFPMQTKGGGKQIRPRRIVVTSQYSIAECWPFDRNLQDAIHRRFEVVHLPHWKHSKPFVQIIPDCDQVISLSDEETN